MWVHPFTLLVHSWLLILIQRRRFLKNVNFIIDQNSYGFIFFLKKIVSDEDDIEERNLRRISYLKATKDDQLNFMNPDMDETLDMKMASSRYKRSVSNSLIVCIYILSNIVSLVNVYVKVKQFWILYESIFETLKSY